MRSTNLSNIRRFMFVATIAAGAAWMPAPADATIVITYGTEFSGSGDTTASNPFATATINQVDADTVSIAIDLFGAGPGAFVTGAYFNYGTTEAQGNFLQGATVATGGTQPPTSVQVASNAFQADGDGLYDILFSYPSGPPAARFVDGDTSTVSFTIDGITEALFNNLSAPAGGHGPFTSVLRVQGLGPNNEGSGWFAGDPSVVPIPAAVLLFGTGLLGMTLLGRRRRASPAVAA